MKKLTLLTLAISLCIGYMYAIDEELTNLAYDITSNGYLALPKQAKNGIVVTDNRHSAVYLIQDNNLKTLVSSPGCGRYTNLNNEKTLLGFKSINEYAEQAPAILDLTSGKVTLLEPYSNQCGQVSFSEDGTVAYTVENILIVNRNGQKTTYDLGFYTNIVNLSPDGKSVAFSDPDGKPVLMNLAEGIPNRISDVLDVYNPKWSPDGKKIIYEQANMTLYAYELPQKRFTYLSKGSSAEWLSDSENIVFTQSEYENQDIFQFKGSSVHQMSFDGKVRRVLVPTTMEVPQEVGVLDNDRIAISYSNGARRRIAAISVGTLAMRKKSSIALQAPPEEVLFSVPDNKKIGKIHAEFKVNMNGPAVRYAAAQTNANLIAANAIPYINQVHDTPKSYQDCYTYGSAACAPSTACMLMAWYGVLEKCTGNQVVDSRMSGDPWGTKNYYSWYVGQQYESPHTGYIFEHAAKPSSKNCYAKGGYGYMWCKTISNGSSHSPSSTMAGFYHKNGVTNAQFDYNGYSKIKSECDAGYPYSWCITSSRSNGHVILPYRGGYIYNKSTGVFTEKKGSVVVMDPYGDANNSTWLGDGRNASYDYKGYNNGKLAMTNAWGVVVRYAKTPTIATSSSLTINTTANKSVTVSHEITGGNLKGNISVSISSSTAFFSVSPATLTATNGSVNSSIQVTYKPTKAGTHTATITLSSSEATTQTVTVTGIAKVAPLAFTEGWNFSESTSKPSWITNFANLRNMDFGNGKLYIANTEEGLIHVINARTGEHIKNLDMTNVEGGHYNFIDVQYIDGKIIACNLAFGSKNQPFKVYVWDNDNAKPRILLETHDFGGFDRIGDCIGIKGNLTNGSLHFACANTNKEHSILYYTIENGICVDTPFIQPLYNQDGTPMKLGVTPRAIPNADGKWWVDGSNDYLTLVLSDGNYYAKVPATATNNISSGNTFDAFEFKGSSYAFLTSYAMGSTTLTYGRAVLVDGSNGWTSAENIGEYPSAGMGASRNTSFSTSVATSVNGDKGVEMWVLINNQGIAYYKHGTVPTDTTEDSDPPVTPPITEMDDNVILSEQWNISETSGKTANWITNGAQVTQDMTFANGKLYVVHRASAADNKVYIVDAYTGIKCGELDITPCTVGTHLISSVETLDGKVLACNLAAGASSELRVYQWDNDNATPSILLSTTAHAEVRAGDAFSVSGNLTNGKLWFGFADKVYYYTITNGTCEQTPTIINLTRNGTAYNVGASCAANYITANPDGSFWVSGKDKVTTRFNAVGEWQEEFSSDIVSNYAGTAAQFFEFGRKKYAVLANYLNKTTTSGLAEGTFVLANVTNGIADATLVDTYPINGLGSSRNTSFRTTLCTEIVGNVVNMWVLVPFQGAAYYKYTAQMNPTNLLFNESSKVTLYNNAETLYVSGVKVSQIELYSIMGQKVCTAHNCNELSISSLQGIYLVVIKDTMGRLSTRKIMIE